MAIIKVIYDDGNNSMIKVQREARKSGKKLSEMTNKEMMNVLFGLVR